MNCKLYMKNEDFPENKKIFNYGFKHVNTEKKGIIIYQSDVSQMKYIKMINYSTSGLINL